MGSSFQWSSDEGFEHRRVMKQTNILCYQNHEFLSVTNSMIKQEQVLS